MTINAATGAKLYVGTSAIPVPGNFDPSDPSQLSAALASFEADSYIQVGEIEDMGNFGDTSAPINFTSLSDSRVRKKKGPRDAGTMTLVVGNDASDEGQVSLIAAEASNLDFNFKVILNDATTLGGNGSQHYFFGQVMSKSLQVGNATNIVRRNFSIGINSAIASVDPT